MGVKTEDERVATPESVLIHLKRRDRMHHRNDIVVIRRVSINPRHKCLPLYLFSVSKDNPYRFLFGNIQKSRKKKPSETVS